MSQPRCLSCMSELSASPCPACGADPGSLPDNQLYLPPGITLNNRYLIGKVIGVGGFGVVYLGWDTNLDVRVAVKEFLPKDIAGRSNDHVSLIPYADKGTDDLQYGIQKFLEEAKALARFQDHPGIVKVSESFKANNTAYMVMQYLDGMTLKEYLKRQPGERILYDVAAKTLTPIMDALREVYKAGFVHRDISPDNIFITRQKQVKLLDFGAARYAMGEHSKSLTSILKHGYAPMEQYSTKGNQGPWTDVYAVAATLYRCITGETPPDAMERVQEECIRTPRQMGVDIPARLESALMKGLALRAEDRFDSVDALQQVFEEVAVERKVVVEEEKEEKLIVIKPQPAARFDFMGLEMVEVPGGCFQMGNTFDNNLFDNEKPVHEVYLDTFYIGKYEVTQGLWRMIMGNNPSYFRSCGNDWPVEYVSWNDAQDFISKLNSQTGKHYRLPTEAEWEYAARSGGKQEKYSGGNDVDSVAWYNENSGDKTHKVGTKQPNGLGIYDMSGNVWEWCSDWYGRYPTGSGNHTSPTEGKYKVLRGGSWLYNPEGVRASRRFRLRPDDRIDDNGFRLVLSQD